MNDKNESTKDKTVGISPSKNTTSFSHDQLWAALRDGADLLDRCQIPGFLLGDASRNAWDGTDLSGDKIVFGIKSGEYTDLTKSTIRSMRPGAILEENEARYLTNGVPRSEERRVGKEC